MNAITHDLMVSIVITTHININIMRIQLVIILQNVLR